MMTTTTNLSPEPQTKAQQQNVGTTSLPVIIQNVSGIKKATFIAPDSEGKTRNFSILGSDPNFTATLAAIFRGDATAAIEFASVTERLKRQLEGKVEVSHGQVLWAGKPLHNALTSRILEFVEFKIPFHFMTKFLEKVLANECPRALSELYPFLENKGMPITEDGCFLGYKVVQLSDDGHYYDKYSGTVINDVGTKVARERVAGIEDWGTYDCSNTYFHVGNLHYAGPEGHYNSKGNDRVVIVKVDPRDVISVSESASKLVTVAYEVVSDFERVFTEPLVNTSGVTITPALEEAVEEFAEDFESAGEDYLMSKDDEETEDYLMAEDDAQAKALALQQNIPSQPWKFVITKAVKNLPSRFDLASLYNFIASDYPEKTKTKTWKATVRRTLREVAYRNRRGQWKLY
jgi:hypothetical protein